MLHQNLFGNKSELHRNRSRCLSVALLAVWGSKSDIHSETDAKLLETDRNCIEGALSDWMTQNVQPPRSRPCWEATSNGSHKCDTVAPNCIRTYMKPGWNCIEILVLCDEPQESHNCRTKRIRNVYTKSSLLKKHQETVLKPIATGFRRISLSNPWESLHQTYRNV